MTGISDVVMPDDIAVDSAGNVIVVGAKSPAGNPYRFAAFVKKYDPCGNVIWTDIYDTAPATPTPNSFPYLIATAVAVDSSDNIYVTGSLVAPSSALGGALAFTGWTRGYSSGGTVLWTVTTLQKEGGSIAVDSVGNIIVAGTHRCIECPTGYIAIPWLIKYASTAGGSPTVVWEKDYTTGDFSRTDTFQYDAVATDSSNNIYLSGNYVTGFPLNSREIRISKRNPDGSVDGSFGGGTGTVSYSRSDECLARYTGPGPAYDCAIARKISIDSDNRLYVAGSRDDNFWIGKFDSSGSELWSPPASHDGGYRDDGWDVTIDSLGSVYSTGIASTTAFVPGPGAIDYQSVWIGKFAADKTNIWNLLVSDFGLGSGIVPMGPSIAADPTGNIYVAGTIGAIVSTGTGREDYLFVRKYPPDGVCPTTP